MQLFNDIINFFGLVPLEQTATFIDLINYIIAVFVAVFIVAFVFRCIFMVCQLPERYKW